MLAFITTTTIKDGMAEEYEALLRDVASQSEALEPGCLAFKAMRVQGEANRYMVVEQYVDRAALDAHRQADYFNAAMARIGDFLAGQPEIVACEGINLSCNGSPS
jgi:quinol monooxygenase YgiN